MSTRNERSAIRGFFARAFGGEGGVIEPSQKAIIIAVLLGIGVGAMTSKPAREVFNDSVASNSVSDSMEVEFLPAE